MEYVVVTLAELKYLHLYPKIRLKCCPKLEFDYKPLTVLGIFCMY